MGSVTSQMVQPGQIKFITGLSNIVIHIKITTTTKSIPVVYVRQPVQNLRFLLASEKRTGNKSNHPSFLPLPSPLSAALCLRVTFLSVEINFHSDKRERVVRVLDE